jgi:hypothetical protein
VEFSRQDNRVDTDKERDLDQEAEAGKAVEESREVEKAFQKRHVWKTRLTEDAIRFHQSEFQ